MSNFDIRDTKTKLIAQTGEPLTAKTTTSILLGKELQAPVIDLDIPHYEHIQEDPERSKYFLGVDMLPNEKGRDYFIRCLASGTVPKDKFVRWYYDALPFVENKTDKILEYLASSPVGTSKQTIEAKLGKAITFCPEHLTKDFICANFVFLGKMRHYGQAFETIGNLAKRKTQIEIAKKRDGVDYSKNGLADTVFGSFAEVIGDTAKKANFIINAKFDSRDNERVAEIAQDIKNKA